MDETVLKIALAGLLHDIGKFAEDGMYASPEFLNGNADLYQPSYKGCSPYPGPEGPAGPSQPIPEPGIPCRPGGYLE